MLKYLERDLSDRMLCHFGENQLAKLGKQGCGKSQQTVANDQGNRHDKQSLSRVRWHIKLVDQILEQDGNAQVGKLGRHQARNGQRETELVFEQVGKELSNDLPVCLAVLMGG